MKNCSMYEFCAAQACEGLKLQIHDEPRRHCTAAAAVLLLLDCYIGSETSVTSEARALLLPPARQRVRQALMLASPDTWADIHCLQFIFGRGTGAAFINFTQPLPFPGHKICPFGQGQHSGPFNWDNHYMWPPARHAPSRIRDSAFKIDIRGHCLKY